MKKIISSFAVVLAATLFLSSCHSYTVTVGQGSQTGIEYREKNHYLIEGLAPLKISDPEKMARGAKDYEVTTKHTFVDGLVHVLTFGIYAPTTTIVRK
ncbi:Bor family protein [Lunatimonas salinarum]|uniref:Bor family protein n=1 Tax=Lunatimonas salinarum TaxID=1774590 RepID=UPI001AE01670|nr:Bor family protein [Lunatimonas salinarum]